MREWGQKIVFAAIGLAAMFLAIEVTSLQDENRQLERQLQVQAAELTECQTNVTSLAEYAHEREYILFKAAEHEIEPELSTAIYETAQKYGIHPWIFYRLIDVESDYRSNVRSHANAVGLTQVKFNTARIFDPDLQHKDLYHERKNLEYGAQYLASLLRRYDGDYRKALMAYHRGPYRLEKEEREGQNHGTSMQYQRRVLGAR